MTNFKIIMQNLTDAAEITAIGGSAFETTLPVTNLQKYGNARVARLTTPLFFSVQLEWPSDISVDGFVMWRHTFTKDAVITVQFYPEEDLGGDPIFSTGSTSVPLNPLKSLDELDWGVDPLNARVSGDTPTGDGPMGGSTTGPTGSTCFAIWFDVIIARSCRVTVYDVTSEQDYVDVGRLYIGRSFSCERNVCYGLKNAIVDQTTQTRSSGGGLTSYTLPKFRKLSFKVDEMTNKERTGFFENYAICGKSKDTFVSVFPTKFVTGANTQGALERDYSFAGKFVAAPETTLDNFNAFSQPFELEEC